MAFSAFGNPVMGSQAVVAGGNVQKGPDLVDIQTENLGFSAIAGDARLQLLSTPWPADNLPPATASLLSIASHKQLLAAAGPDSVILASTEAVRRGFEGPKTADSDFRPFQPQLTLSMPMRISQLVFSADENYLVLSAETGGGLAVYDIQSLLNGNTQSVFELSTNGQALRCLVPNPTSERAELLAVVTNDGNLLMANLKEKNFVVGPKGQILKTGVSCVSWSTRGKQLVAGLGDGTVSQLTPEGLLKGEIPRPPDVNGGEHVSSIAWLENNIFLTVHTPTAVTGSPPPESMFHIVTRDLPSNGFTYQKLIDPAGPFGFDGRSTPHHFLLRLKDFPPNLQDLIAVASTASTDIGLFTRSKTPLTLDKPVNEITGVFTLTEMSDDSRRAQIPMAPGLKDTSPIGFAFDFSSKEKVLRPIPSDSEINESLTPLPLLTVLNNDGVLAAWWVIYNESIRQGTGYPGLSSVSSSSLPSQLPTNPEFGAPAPTNAFGTLASGHSLNNSAKPTAFGAPSGLGQKTSVWGSSSASSPSQVGGVKFGTPAFGSASTLGSTTTFGSSGLSGNRGSPWNSAGPSNAPTFGQSSTFGKPSQPFGASANISSNVPSSGGFASFANGGGFTSATGSTTATGGSLFGQKPSSGSFGDLAGTAITNTSSPFNVQPQKSTQSIFGAPVSTSSTSTGPLFGTQNTAGSNPFSPSSFVLGSTFKAAPNTKEESEVTSTESKNSFLGGGFLNSLADSNTPQSGQSVSEEADMDIRDDTPTIDVAQNINSTSPASTPAVSKFNDFTTDNSKSLKASGIFSFSTKSDQQSPQSVTGPSLGKPSLTTPLLFSSATPGDSPAVSVSLSEPAPIQLKTQSTAQVKEESPSEPRALESIPLAPVPPDATSKDSYAAGDTSNSSVEVNDAPLPPDFLPKKSTPPFQKSVDSSQSKHIPPDMLPPLDVPGGPSSGGESSTGLTEDEEESYDEASDQEHVVDQSEEGSGEDIANDLSPTSEIHQTPAITPQHSFGTQQTQTPDTFFTKVHVPVQAPKLFGEVQRSAPILPPPKNITSPRSPSPVRSALPGRILRPESSRSVSAPGIASQILSKPGKSLVPSQSSFLSKQQGSVTEIRRQAELIAVREAQEAIRLVDDQDDEIQAILASDLEPSAKLAEFTAHTEYVSGSLADSIPQQVETVYRDINSMIDTLGLNVRALKNFTAYQEGECKDQGRCREDLESEEDWCLEEIEALSSVISSELALQLSNGKPHDFPGKVQQCQKLEKELGRLRAKQEDLRRVFELYLDGSHDEIARSQPLSAEQLVQQQDLRFRFKTFQEHLSKVEEGLMTLRASIVSSSLQSSKSRTEASPTVEAIMRTISKMTSMAEKRSGDIDVLEGQMRTLNFDPPMDSNGYDGFRFTTPQKNRASISNFGSSSPSRFYTPESGKDPRKNLRNSVMSSAGSAFTTYSPRKKISGYTTEEKAHVNARLARKKMVTDRLRRTLATGGTKIWVMDQN